LEVLKTNPVDPGAKLATNSLERGLAVLRMIGRKRGGLTHAEISHGLEIPKSTCTYILKRLEREGFVMRNKGTGRYRIGVDVLPLAHNALLEVSLLSLAKPVLRELAKSTGLVAILGVRAGNRVIAIDCLDGAAFAVNSAEGMAREQRPCGEPDGIGAEYSLNSSAPGKVLLAYSRQNYLANTGRAGAQPDATPGMPPAGAAKCQITELEHIRERGYAIRERRFALTPFSIAAPVIDAKGNIRAALCIQENVLRPGNRDVKGWVMLLKKASQEISKRLGMPSVGRDASTDRTEVRPGEQTFPPQSMNHPATRSAYATAHRSDRLGGNCVPEMSELRANRV
jgi:DNA-binding IclR family transcriptional regulator